jgi:aryl-alcohol dehydrogenase-like predicted oxidoreductase
MPAKPSRRDFIAASLALPALGAAMTGSSAAADRAPRQKRRLGNTGLEIDPLGFGCMITSDPSVIARALDMGLDFYDTALVYQGGNNEKMVGQALGARRKDVVLCTKTPSTTRDKALADLDTSLASLGTDHVDIWYLHGKSKPEDLSDELIEAQQIAKQKGKIRFAGVSTHSGHAALFPAVIAKRSHFDVILTSYNFSMEPTMEGLISQASEAGIGVVAMKTMAGGFRKQKADAPLGKILGRDGALPAALKWVLRNPKVDVAIPSMTDMDQLEENFAATALPFSTEDEKLLVAQLSLIRPLYCRSCGQCDGTCRQGIPVADVLRHMSYVEGYGDYRLGRESYQALPRHVVQADCGACPSCTVSCPHGVQVAQRVARAQQWLA